MSLAQTCMDVTTAMFGAFGATVTITRRAATAGGSPTTTTASCMMQPLNQTGYTQLRLEGVQNLNEAEAHLFLFAPGTDIREAIDSITHNGESYRVLMQDEQTLTNLTVVPFAVAVRV